MQADNVVAVTTAATRRFPVRDGLSAAPKGVVEALYRLSCSILANCTIRTSLA